MESNEVIGLIPCGGHASRISPLPCSKEVLPVGLSGTSDCGLRPKVVSCYLLEQMRLGGVRKAFLVLRKGKWDIPAYYGNGVPFGLDLGYLIVSQPHGPAYTIDAAYPFLRGSRVAFGFPDILFEPQDVFERALARLSTTGADVVLALCRARDTRAEEMIETDREGRVRELFIKPKATNLKLGWVLAVWTKNFTEYLHQYITAKTEKFEKGSEPVSEVTPAEVIQAAVRDGMVTQSVAFPNHYYLDIGTPNGLQRVIGGHGARWPEVVRGKAPKQRIQKKGKKRNVT